MHHKNTLYFIQHIDTGAWAQTVLSNPTRRQKLPPSPGQRRPAQASLGKVCAMRWAKANERWASEDSTMMRNSGSVPLGRTSTRP
jgi:hypothetical protein